MKNLSISFNKQLFLSFFLLITINVVGQDSLKSDSFNSTNEIVKFASKEEVTLKNISYENQSNSIEVNLQNDLQSEFSFNKDLRFIKEDINILVNTYDMSKSTEATKFYTIKKKKYWC